MKTCVVCGTTCEDLNTRHICADCAGQGFIGEHSREARELLEEAAGWLESRPDFTEGDAATSSSIRAFLARTAPKERGIE